MAHCRYLEPNANNNLTFREMHEPIYGCYRHGLAPEPLTPENSENFDVATVSAQSALGPLGTLSLFRARAIYRVGFPHGWHLLKKTRKINYIPRATILRCRSITKPVANAMPFIAGYIRVFDLWTRGGAKSYSSALLGNGRG